MQMVLFAMIVLLLLMFHHRPTVVECHDEASKTPSIPNLDDLNILDAELQLARKEHERTTALFQQLKSEGYHIHGFYHSSTWQEYWREVISEQLYLLDGRRKFPHSKNGDISKLTGSHNIDHATYEWDTQNKYTSLLSVTDELYMNVAGKDLKEFQDVKALVTYLLLDNVDKIHLNFNYSLIREIYDEAVPQEQTNYDQTFDLSSGEYPTIVKLKEHCVNMKSQGKKSLVYYFHSKGPCCWKDYKNIYSEKTSYRDTDNYNGQLKFSPVATWRDLMNAAVLEFPSICLRAILDKKYSACGAENQLAHYSGNFWWADCDHVAQLEFPPNRFDWRKPEFFILFAHKKADVRERFGFRCGYSVFNCGVHFYKHECPRSKYRTQFWQNVWGDLAKSTANRGITTEEYLPQCEHIRKQNQSLLELNSEFLEYFGK